jgi:uncharacterized membrane protein
MVNKYPTDRVNNFSDAIFAIAITLLVLDVKVPPTETIDSQGLIQSFQKSAPSFIGLLVSFFVTALYWRAHLSLIQFIKSYDNKLLWLNIWLLLFVVILPFSTALYSKNFAYTGPFVFYCINLVMIGVFNYLMIEHVIKTSSSEFLTPVVARWMKFRGLVAPVIWLASAGLAFVLPNFSRFAFILIFILLAIGERRFRRKVA